MSENPDDAYWQSIAQSRSVEELGAAIRSDTTLAANALVKHAELLARLEHLTASAAVDQLRWLGIELAEAAGNRRAGAGFEAQRQQAGALEALRRGDKAQAAVCLSRSAAASLQSGVIEQSIRITHAAATLLFRLKEYDAALCASEALIDALGTSGFERPDTRTALYEFAHITNRAPAGDRWANILARLCAGMTQAGDQVIAAAITSHLAATLTRSGACEEAQELLADNVAMLDRMAIKTADGKIAPVSEAAQARLWKARVWDLMGREREAEDAYRGHEWLTAGAVDERAEVISRLAELLIQNNRLQEALNLLRANAPENVCYRAHTQALIGWIYALLNRSEASAEAAREALTLLEQDPEQEHGASFFERSVIEGRRALEALFVPNEIVWRTHLTVVESAVTRKQVQREHQATLQEVLAWTRQHGERALEAQCLRLEGEILLAAGENNAAVQKLEAALTCELTRNGTWQWKNFGVDAKAWQPNIEELRVEQTRRTRLEAGVGMETLLALGHAQAAAGLAPCSSWDAAIAAAQRRNRRLTLYYALVAKSRWLRSTDEAGESQALLENAADVLESLRAELTEIESQVGVLEDKELIYGELLQAAVETSDAGLAMRLMERAKSRALLEEICAQEPRPPLKAEQEQEARGMRLELARALEAQAEGAASQALDIERLKDRFAFLFRQEENRRFAPQAAARADDAARLSAGNNALIEYFVSEQQVVVAVARDGQLAPPLCLSISKAEIADLLETLQREIRNRVRCHSLGRLYSVLIRPIEHLIDGSGQLLFVPHGALHMVPFHALLSPDGEYLAQKFTIHYAPSAAVAWETARRSVAQNQKGALLIAVKSASYSSLPELANAENEVEQIAKALPGAQILTGRDAVRRQLVRRTSDVDVLHLTCHGEFDYDDPLLSRIYLADGPLYGYEIERLSFRPRLAVLSACETALQRRMAGDETFGLVRAFLSRGTEAVIASLWKVADASTAKLMEAFYRERSRNTDDVAGALRAAQLEMLSSPQYKHPFFWAPYIVIGGAKDRTKHHE